MIILLGVIALILFIFDRVMSIVDRFTGENK